MTYSSTSGRFRLDNSRVTQSQSAEVNEERTATSSPLTGCSGLTKTTPSTPPAALEATATQLRQMASWIHVSTLRQLVRPGRHRQRPALAALRPTIPRCLRQGSLCRASRVGVSLSLGRLDDEQRWCARQAPPHRPPALPR